jgi:acetyl-CoA acetyltransferase family protein
VHSEMTEAWILSAARTPIGRHRGVLASIRPDDLAATALAAALDRSGVDLAEVDHVILGAANQAGEDNRNVARMALLLAGLPETVPAFTVNRLCGSGMTAIASARQMIVAGDADVVIAGGVESMTRAPWVMEKPARGFTSPGAVHDTSIGWRFTNPWFDERTTIPMTGTAEEVARRYSITREDSDKFAAQSHARAVAAQDSGSFEAEIAPVQVGEQLVSADEGPRQDTSLEKLAVLRPVTGPGGIVTAGNSSSLNDGASAVVVVSDRYLASHAVTPRARIVATAEVGVAPEVMGIGPVPATQRVLERAGWSIDDLQAIELNEAFASQALACIRELYLDPALVNADGGAIALGHPLGSSGTRIVATLLGRMDRTGAHRGLATMCVGVGQGTALLVERP